MRSKRRTIARRGRRVIAVVLLGLALSGSPGVAEEAPPGTLVQVGDSRLYVACRGEGEPTVVFLAGLGGNSLDWTLVQALVARRHRACTYDRPGAGWSERTTRPRDAEVMADELRDATRAAGIGRPFVLVGHSFGGLLAQFIAGRHPDEVAGLVLVDAVHPDQEARFAAVGVDLPKDPHALLGNTPPVAAADGLPPDLRALAIDLVSARKARIFVVREFMAMRAIAADVRRQVPPGLPTRVLVHGAPEWDAAYPDGRMERAWRDMQADLALTFHAPPPTVVARSGHQIPLEGPEAVADAIDAVVGQGR